MRVVGMRRKRTTTREAREQREREGKLYPFEISEENEKAYEKAMKAAESPDEVVDARRHYLEAEIEVCVLEEREKIERYNKEMDKVRQDRMKFQTQLDRFL